MQPECISQRASSGRLNCSCSRSRDLTAINPVVPEMMKIAALAVSTAPGGNMSFAFSKSVPNIDTILYRSTFEYHESSFEKLKETVNNYRLKKVEPYNYDLTDENTILRLYCGDKLSTSVECYNKRTNIIAILC